MTNSRLFKQQFLSVGTFSWKCPPGIKFVWVIGCGGGGGGGGGAATSSTNNAFPTYWNYYALGGGGGQPAPTFMQVVAVTPGVTYTVSIGAGGVGGIGGQVYNGAGTSTTIGGVSPGYSGFQGGSSIFGTVVFPGGIGGKRGEIFSFGNANSGNISGGTNNNSSPPLPATLPAGVPQQATLLAPAGSPLGADALCQIGMISIGSYFATFPNVVASGQQFPYHYLANGNVAGGGGAGGVSNNIYSLGGLAGQGAGYGGYPFSGGGGNGAFGGGGGGGGGGEGHNYNNTHDGSGGGTGGNGFLEISWMA